ncbi:hypothetical protein L596_001741 [Steinernema carpocapsae]|uniref:Uncharacterized protein n=1 Tax=Steinernema carpocapsae TaxID=34508 RepID=A0A4U8UN50_STECR|nr:hypothetical protein L596_001741 [Steinernema carpocapsae]
MFSSMFTSTNIPYERLDEREDMGERLPMGELKTPFGHVESSRRHPRTCEIEKKMRKSAFKFWKTSTPETIVYVKLDEKEDPQMAEKNDIATKKS